MASFTFFHYDKPQPSTCPTSKALISILLNKGLEKLHLQITTTLVIILNSKDDLNAFVVLKFL